MPAHPLPTRPAALVVDALGKPCPLPLIDLARALPTVAVGEEIEVLADDPGARADIPAWCRMKGHEFLGTAATGAAWRFRVRRAS